MMVSKGRDLFSLTGQKVMEAKTPCFISLLRNRIRCRDPFKNKRMLPGAILKCVFITDTKHRLSIEHNPLTGQNSHNYPYIYVVFNIKTEYLSRKNMYGAADNKH